jgi:polar amino acid transport system substrate-binding protein
VTELTRRQVLRAGAALGVLVGTGGIIAACAAPAASTAGSGAPASGAGGSSAPAGETTLARMKRTKTARLGFTNEPPFSIAEPDKVTGIDPDIMRAFLASQGVDTIDGVLMEFASLIPALLANRIDSITAGLWISPARCAQIAFSDPTVQIGQAFAVKKGNPKHLDSYKSVATAGATFGAVKGGLEFGWADKAGIAKDHQVEFPDFQTGIAGLQSGRVDCISNTDLAIADIVAKLKDPNLEVAKLTEQPVGDNGKSTLAYSSFGFRKEDADFVTAFNTWIKEQEGNGGLLKIVSPFGITKDSIPPAESTAAKICAG